MLSAIEAETAKRAESYAAAPVYNRFPGAEPGTPVDSPARIHLDWNPGSPVSARALVLAAENRLERISDAILVCSPPQIRREAPLDLNFTDIEILFNDHVKGWFFLIKELAAAFKAKGEGTLSLVYPEVNESPGEEEAPGLLGHSALAVFRTLTRDLLASAFSEPFITLGFTGVEEPGFAAFIFKQLEEKTRRANGKLYKYGKLSFFK